MSWRLLEECRGETRAEHEAAQPLYCRLCGNGGVTVKRYPATHLDPPETDVICHNCGDLSDDQVSEYRQERREGCGVAWTDHGRPCEGCEGGEEDGQATA